MVRYYPVLNFNFWDFFPDHWYSTQGPGNKGILGYAYPLSSNVCDYLLFKKQPFIFLFVCQDTKYSDMVQICSSTKSMARLGRQFL